MTTHNTVEVFLGTHIDVPAEQQFLARLQRDLRTLEVRARILANLQIGPPGDRQIDFVVSTEHCTTVIELKTFPGRIVVGPRNGPWTVQIGKAKVEERSNPLSQVLHAAQFFSDELHAFAKTVDVPGPTRSSRTRGAKFYTDLDAVACVFSAVPDGSEWEQIKHTWLVGYDELLERLQADGPRLAWSAEDWDRFVVQHLNLYRADEDAAENQVRRGGAAVVDGYIGLYREANDGLGPVAQTAVRVNGQPDARPDVTALVSAGATVLLRGESGTGKTLWAQAVASELAAGGNVPVWIQADTCDGPFLTACAQAIAPYTPRNVNELIKAADVAGRVVVFIVDDLAQISGEGRRRLIEGLRTIRVRGAGRGLLITDQASGAPELGDHTDVEVPLPEGEDRVTVLAAYGHAELIDRCAAFTTPFELSLAAACAGELGPDPTRVDLLDTYVDGRLGGDAVSRGALAHVASYMFTELRPFPRQGDVTQRLRRCKLTDEQIQTLYDCDLLVLSRGRIAFAHEQFELFMATEAMLAGSDDAVEISRRLNTPRSAGLRRFAIAMESDRDRLQTMLSLCEDPCALVDAALGHLGPDAAETVQSVFAEVLNDACARTAQPGIRVQFTGNDFHACRWQMPTSATRPHNAGMDAIGKLLQRGRYVDRIDALVSRTDELVTAAIDQAEPKSKRFVTDQVFAAAYAFDQCDGLPINPLANSVTHRAFSIIPDADRMRDTIARVIGDIEQAGLGALWIAVHLMHDPRVEIRADVIIRSLQTRPYHLLLQALNLAEDRAGRMSVRERELVTEAVEALPTDNLILNSSITEALAALGALQPAKSTSDVEEEIAAVLGMRGNRLAERRAAGVVSAQWEIELIGPYFEVVSGLDPDDRVRLLAMALNGSEYVFMNDDWIMAELNDLDEPEVRDAVIAWVARNDPKDWMSVQHGLSATVEALTLLDAAHLPIPAAKDVERSPEWDATMTLITTAAHAEPDQIADAWRRFTAEHPYSVASLIINLHRVDRWNRDRSVVERLEAAVPDEAIAAMAATLEHPERAVSIPRWDHDLRRDLVVTLGRLGNRAAADTLRRFADNPNLGDAVADAVRAIEGRSA
jgi:hypothetical protein